MKNAIRQPTSWAKRSVSRRIVEANAPIAAPAQYVPLIARSTRPRKRPGISSSTAEFTAEYSPPIPMPEMNRKMRNISMFGARPAAAAATR